MKEFSERLQYLIDNKKISQADLVTQTGINKSTVSLWVNGKVTPGVKNQHVLCDFFRCSFEWLAEGKGSPFPTETTLGENVAAYQPYKAARDVDKTLDRIMREKFKQQCGTVYLDGLFDFIGDNYGETKEAVDKFLSELVRTHANYRFWLQEKKGGKGSNDGGHRTLTVNEK